MITFTPLISPQTQLAGASVPTLSAPGVRIIGDSIVSQNASKTLDTDPIDSGTADTINYYPRFWTIFMWLHGNPLNFESYISRVDWQRYGSNSGIGGDTWDGVLARIEPILATMPEQYMFFHCGTNDINGGDTLDEITSDVEACVALCMAYGVTPILSTVLGRNAANGADWGTAGGTTTAQKRLVLSAFNAWLTEYCRYNGYILVDFNAVTSDDVGDIFEDWTSDGVHPNLRGAYYMALELERTLGHLIPKQRNAGRAAYDVYDATYNPHGNLILNPDFSGVGGTLVSTGYLGTFVGVSGGSEVPDDWRFTLKSGGLSDVTLTVVDLPDGTGKALDIEFTSPGGGSSGRDYRLEVYNIGSANITVATGDLIKASAEIQYFQDDPDVIQGIGWYITGDSPVTYIDKTTVSFDAELNRIVDSANGLGSFVADYYVYVEGAAETENNGRFYITEATAGYLQLADGSGIVDEAAGSTTSIAHPTQRVSTLASAAKAPNEDTDVMYMEAPILEIAHGTHLTKTRFNIYIDESVAGTNKVRVAWPSVRKLQMKPTVLDVLANDD